MNIMTKKIVITSEFFGKFSDEGEQLLIDAGFEVIRNPYDRFLNEKEIVSIIRDADGIICDLENINQTVIDNAPNLKIISRRGVGLDSVDVVYAESKNIRVSRTLGVVEKPVAELVMSYMLNITRKLIKTNSEMQEGRWTKYIGNSLSGKTLGLLGMGNIACELARKAKAFDMEIVYNATKRNMEAEELFGAKYLQFNDLMAYSDIVSVHVPLLESTKNMIDYNAIKMMKRAPIVINTARGPIVNEEDLCRALKEGLVSYAAIDVFDVEPKIDSCLKGVDKVILTPHIGTFTKETFIEMDVRAAINIVEYLGRT